MRYIPVSEVIETIRVNLHKIPHDIDFVIGIPRSGMLPATLISEYLHVPLVDLESFVAGLGPGGGNRLSFARKGESGKVLLVDDTIYNGRSMRLAKGQLNSFPGLQVISLVVFKEGPSNDVDIFLQNVRQPGNEPVLYGYNVFHHYPERMRTFSFDIDGVLCLDPPDERKTSEYEAYIANPVPLVLPEVVGQIVTYRLEKYRSVTEAWLRRVGIQFSELIMFPAYSWEERYRSGISPEQFKAHYFGKSSSRLFIESNDWQAREIHRMTAKPVLCFETDKIYQ